MSACRDGALLPSPASKKEGSEAQCKQKGWWEGEGYMRQEEGRNGKRLRVGWPVLEALGEETPEDLLDLTPKENMTLS